MKCASWLMAVFVALPWGCASGPRATMEPRTLSVESSPSGAKVYRVGPVTEERYLVGTTPIQEQRVDVLTSYRGSFISERGLERMAARIGRLHLVVEKPGYAVHETVLSVDSDEPYAYHAELERVDNAPSSAAER